MNYENIFNQIEKSAASALSSFNKFDRIAGAGLSGMEGFTRAHAGNLVADLGGKNPLQIKDPRLAGAIHGAFGYFANPALGDLVGKPAKAITQSITTGLAPNLSPKIHNFLADVAGNYGYYKGSTIHPNLLKRQTSHLIHEAALRDPDFAKRALKQDLIHPSKIADVAIAHNFLG